MNLSERVAAGKAARSEAPRSAHAAWEPPPDRADPIGILEAQARSRVPELVPIRYGRMAVSPFSFFRGAAAVMAADLATTPISGLRVQACGDAHLTNFGTFAAPDRRLVFDLNDFDESLPGPWEWDVKRLAASFAIAGRENGFKAKQRREVVLRAVGNYREAMRGFASLSDLDVWYARLDVEALLGNLPPEAKLAAGHKALRRAERGLAKARSKDNMRAFDKLTHTVDGELRIVSDPPLIVPIEELLPPGESRDLQQTMTDLLASYRSTMQGDRQHLLGRYQFRHLARKVVGVGSVGTRAWVALFTGADDNDPLFLQAKEAEASVLEPYVGGSRFKNHGRRVVEGQRLTQAASDVFLGWCPAIGFDGHDRDFYVRQLWDWKGSANVESMNPVAMGIYAQMCGWTLARAHARSGDRIAVSGYLGASRTFDEAIAEFSELYAQQSERDHADLRAAIDSGRLVAENA
ncbi:MAG TPA: DUF2252 domain-containing protein [Solirubrobacterales bacterium]|nr:DUF2252 domain-containing protein [Solirubrobacterales bacterium]